MLPPDQATSPRKRIDGPVNVLFTSRDPYSWSIARLRWCSERTDGWRDVVGIRWNGHVDDPDDMGNPRSHGQGTWFILPDIVGRLLASSIWVLDALDGSAP